MIKETQPVMAIVAQAMLTGPQAMHQLIEALRSYIKPEQAIARRNARNAVVAANRRRNGIQEDLSQRRMRSLADQIYIGLNIYARYALASLRERGFIISITVDDYQSWELTETGRAYALRMRVRLSSGMKRDCSPRKKKGIQDASQGSTQEVQQAGCQSQDQSPKEGDYLVGRSFEFWPSDLCT